MAKIATSWRAQLRMEQALVKSGTRATEWDVICSVLNEQMQVKVNDDDKREGLPNTFPFQIGRPLKI